MNWRTSTYRALCKRPSVRLSEAALQVAILHGLLLNFYSIFGTFGHPVKLVGGALARVALYKRPFVYLSEATLKVAILDGLL